jgi:hypothetical protein
MPTVKPKARRPRTRMETWLYANRITYRALDNALGADYDYHNVWDWAQGVPPTDDERAAILEALRLMGFRVKASDLWV